MKTHNIETFLSGTGVDYKNRTYASILSFSNQQLEHKHDYIQCLFPTDAPSMHAPAPIVTTEEAIKMRQNEAVIMNLHLATERMIQFYTEYKGWRHKRNHNYKRISRILRCLRLFGCDRDADKFYEFVMKEIATKHILPIIDQETIEYWNRNNKRIIS